MIVRALRSWLIAIVCSLTLAGCSNPVWRYLAYRISPDRTPTNVDRQIAAAGIDAAIRISFDRFGVPHIRAETERDAAFALGYMHGRDRRFQLEMLRRVAAGRLRELVGEPEGSPVRRLETFSRLIGLPQDADTLLVGATTDERVLLDAYAAGVNHATASEPKPMELRVLGVEPEPWTARDSYLTLALVSFGLCKNWEHELGRLELAVHQLRNGGSLERALAIWKPRIDLPPHLYGSRLPDSSLYTLPAVAPEVEEFLKEFAATARKAEAGAGGDSHGARFASTVDGWPLFFRGGSSSNNWAMGGTWTGSGKGAMGSDPHMPHGMPALGYLAHVECSPCGGRPFRIIGAGFMGLPGITFGTNGSVAWSATSNWADVTDLYLEKPVEGDPSRYVVPGGTESYEEREELFRIRQNDGSFSTETRKVRVGRHGPLVNDFVDRIPSDFPHVALRRQGMAGNPLSSFGALYRTRNVREAREALNGMVAFTGHWALSDADGHVAYMQTARLPRRTAHLGTFAVPGWTGTYEWDGFLANEEIPWVYDPPAGFVASANNQVIHPDALTVPINYEGDVPNRYQRISQLLASPRSESVVDRTRAIHTDGTDPGIAPILDLYRPVLERLGRDSGTLGSAAQALARWDGKHEPDGFEASLWNTFVTLLLERTLADEMSDATFEFVLGYFNIEPFVFSVLGDPTNPAWGEGREASKEEVDATVEATFRAAVAVLREKYGKQPADWKWSRVAPFVLEHPFGSQSALASYVNRELPTTGSGNTVNKQQFVRGGRTRFPVKYGPVLRVNLDLADLGASRMSLPGGESGRPASQHYDDQLELYARGDGVPMEMDFDKIEVTGKLDLVPGSVER